MPVFNTTLTNLTAGTTLNGYSSNDKFGRSVSSLGDINGDGFGDVIVGAYGDSTDLLFQGTARVISGATGDTLFILEADSFNESFGYSVSGAGDVNGDGLDDIIVGGFVDETNGIQSGEARVFSGADGTVLHTFNGDSPFDQFGRSVSGAGDVNGDGFDDVIVGALYDDNNGSDSGSVTVFSGLDGSVLLSFNGNNAGDEFGRSVSGAGDVNGDGFDDVIIGARISSVAGAGRAEIRSGADGTVLFNFSGSLQGDLFGLSVSDAGDVNGDGFSDVIVGSPGDGDYGNGTNRLSRAYVLSGADGTTLFTFTADSLGDGFGGSVSAAGDVNADGFADLIVGADRDDNSGSNSGSARILSGSDGSTLFSFDGDSPYDRFGGSVSSAGDFNGDGFDDVIVGAFRDGNNGPSSGSARIFTTTGTGALDSARIYVEASAPVVLDSDVAVTDAVLDVLNSGNGDYNGASLNIVRQGGGNSDDVFGFSPMANVVVNGGNLEVAGNAIATFTLAGGVFDVSFTNANGTAPTTALVNEIIQAVTYQNTNRSLNHGQQDNIPLDWTFSDGTTDLVDTIVINHQGVIDAPLFDTTLTSLTTAFTFVGDSTGDKFGYAVASAFDVNGDGFSDLIVGAPYDDNTASNSGNVRVLSGSDGSVLFSFDGDSASDLFGKAVAGAGDVNGDGFSDIIVGALGDDNNSLSNSGNARVFSGLDGSILFSIDGSSAGDNFGRSVSSAGDINGDGFDDFAVGANGDSNTASSSGSVTVFSGMDGSVLFTVNGDAASDNFGYAVAAAGDVNGDGTDDLIIGARFHEFARVVSGIDGSTLYTFDNAAPGEYFGRAVSSAGDVNGDGFADVIVGANMDSNAGLTDSGSATVFSGADGSILFTLNGLNPNDEFGGSVAPVGDMNGDGLDDFIIGAVETDNSGFSSGSASIVSGADGSILFTFDGDSSSDFFGRSVSSAGDINNDGIEDVIIGANGDNQGNGGASGSARVLVTTGTGRLDTFREFTERATPVILDNDVAVTDVNMAALNAGNGDYSGASLNIRREGTASSDDVFNFAPMASVTVNGNNLEVGGVAIATFTNVAGVLDVSFTNANGATPTGALVNEIIQAVTYENINQSLGDGETSNIPLAWTFSDGTGDLTDTIRIIHHGVVGGVFVGTAADDTFTATVENDTFDGLAGSDTVDYVLATGAVTVDLGIAGAQNTGSAGTDTLTSIENLTGSLFGDTLTGNNNANILNGVNGNDTLNGLGGNDTLIGSFSQDVLNGGDGDDDLSGDAGNDVIDGGAGTDLGRFDNFGGAVNVNLNLTVAQNTNAAGMDTIVNVENLIGGIGNDRFTGNTGANDLSGQGGSDQLFGLGGADNLSGGAGNDNLQGGNGDDALNGDDGLDTLLGGGGLDTLSGGNGNDQLRGGAGIDSLNGGAGRDVLIGGDFVLGAFPGDGAADTFVFNDVTDSIAGGATRDIIRDFEQTFDIIDLSAIDAITGGSDDAFTLIGPAAFSGTAGELRAFNAGANTVVRADVDGDGTADFEILINGIHPMITADFVM